ncbi:MAG: hypothetical protein KAV00_00995 [Phycisphaerae bacterium]|nr:hypothetical protein [Phycisphaerae bacterium]
MGTYYVDNDVGATGGTGTQGDPYGIETAIAAASAGDVFHWRGGGEGDVAPGHSLNFNNGGTASAPVWWIGTDDDWVPIPRGQTPTTGVDANNGAYAIVTITSAHQIFQSIRIHNALQGRNGAQLGCGVSAPRVILDNCVVHDCATAFSAAQRGLLFIACRAYDTSLGWDITGTPLGTTCIACQVDDADSHAFKTQTTAAFLHCLAYNIGGSGIEYFRDNALVHMLTVDHFSVYDCVDGIRLATTFADTHANVFSVTNSIFDTCSGYAAKVTLPAGQLGFVSANASRNCTSGQVTSGRPGLINEDWHALAFCPFVDASNGDLSLIRNAQVIGAALDGGDLGALQRQTGKVVLPVVGL